MIFQKGSMWKISGYPQKYATLEEAQAVLAKLGIQAEKVEAAKAVEAQKEIESAKIVEADRLERLAKLSLDSTPFEKMIEKNICTTCDMEPCECFTYTKKTDLGE